MKLSKGQLIAAGAALLASNLAMAELYGGANYSAVELDTTATDFDLGAVSGRVGSQVNENLSAEFRVGVGVSDDDSVEIDKYFGGYIRGSLPLNEGIAPYVIAGFTDVDVDSDAGSDSEDDFSYGIGVDFALDNQLTLNVEYMQLIDGDDWEASAFSLGVATRF